MLLSAEMPWIQMGAFSGFQVFERKVLSIQSLLNHPHDPSVRPIPAAMRKGKGKGKRNIFLCVCHLLLFWQYHVPKSSDPFHEWWKIKCLMDSDTEGPSGQGLHSELQKPHEEVKFKYNTPLPLPHAENDLKRQWQLQQSCLHSRTLGQSSGENWGGKDWASRCTTDQLYDFWTCNLLLSFIWILH